MKINLLPPYLHQRKMVKIALAVVVLVTLGEVGAFILLRNGPLAEKARLTEQHTQENAELQRVQSLKSESDALLGSEAGLAPKYDFITGMMTYNEEYPNLYARTADYTYREATMLNLEASANQLKFDAYVAEPRDVSLLLLGLSRSPEFQGLPTIVGVPGFDPSKDRERDAQSSGAIPGTSIIGGVAGDTGDSGAAAGGGMSMGMGAMAGGGGGNGPGGGGSSMGSMGMMGPSASGASSAGMGGSSGGDMGAMGGMGGGGGGTGDLSKLALDQAVRKPKGFTVSVTCVLTRNISRPSYGTSAQQAGAGGGGGGGFGSMGMGGGGAMGMSSNGP